MTPCEAFAESISALLDDELAADAQHELLRHLQDCAACRARSARFSVIDAALRGEASGANAPALEIVRPRIAATTSRPLRHHWWWRGSAAAAALAAVVAIVILMPSAADAAWPAETAATLDVLQQQDRQDQATLVKTLELELRALRLEVRILELDWKSVGDIDHRIGRLLDRVQALKVRAIATNGTPR